jgi:hypothetical protein
VRIASLTPDALVRSLHSELSPRSGSWPMDHGERGQSQRTVQRPKTARATLAINNEFSPVQRRTRGDERNGRSGTACREPGNCDTKSTRRDQIALKGNQPRQRRPRDHSASRSSRHRMQGDRRRAAMQVRLQFFATNRGPHEHEWQQPRIARVNVQGVDVEQRKRNQWVNASASTVRRTSRRMTSGRTGGRGI